MTKLESGILNKIAVAYRTRYSEIQRMSDIKARIEARTPIIKYLKEVLKSPNVTIQKLAPRILNPVTNLFEIQQAGDLRQATAQKTQDDENAQLQTYKTKLTNSVNEISKITNKDEQGNKYFELSKANRDEIATIPEPKKTKVLNIANPILTPIEDKTIAHLKDYILANVKEIEAIKDENAKKQERTQFIVHASDIIMRLHEPLKSKAKAIFDPILKDLNAKAPAPAPAPAPWPRRLRRACRRRRFLP